MGSTSAKFVSDILHPLINPIVAFVLLTATDKNLGLVEKVEFTSIALIFALGFIAAYARFLIHKGAIETVDTAPREQRPGPLAICATIYVLGFLALRVVQAPNLVQGLMFCYAANSLILAIISCWWKVSVHTTAMATPLVVFSYHLGYVIAPLYLLIPLVGSSRVILKRHTIGQVIVGAFLGVSLTAVQIQFLFQ
ncbi:MAG: hypothetical protein QNJ46_15690 [Leptolyngbyaceae cyanobacterium MO_188.B28]|nr:hypothetical protein [Leptolyngbyaceae cyanobacterium MO_188.B28]